MPEMPAARCTRCRNEKLPSAAAASCSLLFNQIQSMGGRAGVAAGLRGLGGITSLFRAWLSSPRVVTGLPPLSCSPPAGHLLATPLGPLRLLAAGHKFYAMDSEAALLCLVIDTVRL